MKKVLMFLSLIALSLLLVSCQKDDKINIGILQFVTADALDDARNGFIKSLEENGYVDGQNIRLTVENPETDNTKMVQQAKRLLRKNDLVLGIATPAAQALVNEAKRTKSNVPILFTAVTDPVSAGLISSNEQPGGNVTGTNDLNPIAEQIALAKELLPEATKLGIIYTSSEDNSEIQANLAKTIAESLGFSVTVKTITNVNQLQQVATSLVKEVEIIYVPTDNTIASAIEILSNVLVTNKIPAVVGEENLVTQTMPALTIGINYYNLGLETGQQAVLILKDGKKPSEIPSKGLENLSFVINVEALEAIEVVIPESLLNRLEK